MTNEERVLQRGVACAVYRELLRKREGKRKRRKGRGARERTAFAGFPLWLRAACRIRQRRRCARVGCRELYVLPSKPARSCERERERERDPCPRTRMLLFGARDTVILTRVAACLPAVACHTRIRRARRRRLIDHERYPSIRIPRGEGDGEGSCRYTRGR